MFGLGILLEDSEILETRRLSQYAAVLGDADTTDTLGTFLKDAEPPEESRLWYKKGVALGNRGAM